MNRPTKADVLEYFEDSQKAADFIGLTRQGVEDWPVGELTEKRFRLLLGSFTRRKQRIPAEFTVEPLRAPDAV